MIRDYKKLLSEMKYSSEIKKQAQNLIRNYYLNRSRYEVVSSRTKVPPEVVFTIHYLECNCNFNCHLHNGDPLTNRTVRVPKGRPKTGTPPFTWEESAIDALNGDYPRKPRVWDVNSTLEYLERYNGLGYFRRGIQSPYIFGNTNLYTGGKFTHDGIFVPEAKTKQIGAAVILTELGFFERVGS